LFFFLSTQGRRRCIFSASSSPHSQSFCEIGGGRGFFLWSTLDTPFESAEPPPPSAASGQSNFFLLKIGNPPFLVPHFSLSFRFSFFIGGNFFFSINYGPRSFPFPPKSWFSSAMPLPPPPPCSPPLLKQGCRISMTCPPKVTPFPFFPPHTMRSFSFLIDWSRPSRRQLFFFPKYRRISWSPFSPFFYGDLAFLFPPFRGPFRLQT